MIAFDIETIPNEVAIKSEAWASHKARHGITDDSMAALHPAFCQIVCICAWDDLNQRKFRMSDPDEAVILRAFSDYMVEAEPNPVLGGHNIKGFDIPVMCCRMLAHRLVIPMPLRMAGKKPWEVPHLDTCETMKFGGGPYLSLAAMCLLLGVESPKQGPVNGASVWDAFKEGRFEDIATYCGKDVNAWLHCKAALAPLRALA